MIKEKNIEVKISNRNKNRFIELGYNINTTNDYILVNISDISKGSDIRITAICEYCQSEKSLPINKYYLNIERNNKGFYSCINCKDKEYKKTCLEKYGVDSYSKTEDFRIIESEKWKGIKKGHKYDNK